MKVLYALWNYPQYSETYIAAEISYALRAGVEVEVWSSMCRHPQINTPCRVHRRSLAEAIICAKPDLIHVHYLVYAGTILDQIPSSLPVTVRGHSFDWNLEKFNAIADSEKVRKIILFPHFAEQVKANKKVVSLPVAYDSTLHYPAVEKDYKHVVRLAAGLPTKGLDKIFKIAGSCPDHKFSLIGARAGGADDFMQVLKKEHSHHLNVEILTDIPENQAIDLNSKAAIYLDTYDPKGHPFGMPISIVEAMATGSLVLAEDHPDARTYVGSGGLMYKDVDEAIKLIQESLSYSLTAWMSISASAMARAALFKDVVVLPKLLETWKNL